MRDSNYVKFEIFRFEYHGEDNHVQAVGGGHGPGQPEHLVLLAILHNPC